jgi:predicted O-methyltransferase YrrM
MIQYKWKHFDEAYAKYLPENPRRILEIGVARGGSIVRWLDKFPEATVTGLYNEGKFFADIYYKTVGHMKRLKLVRADQCNIPASVTNTKYDIIIDDGGHRPYQTLSAFRTLWPRLNEGGLYVIEDTHVSEKLRWRIWQRLFGGPRSILMGLYREMNRHLSDKETQVKELPVVHVHPLGMFIEKKTVTLRIEETEHQYIRHPYETTTQRD